MHYQPVTAQYNTLINKPSATPLPSLIEEHMSVIAGRLGELATIKTKTEEVKHEKWNNNLSQSHQRVLTNLRKNKSNTIKQADKSTCIIIQDTIQYLEYGLKELADETPTEKCWKTPLKKQQKLRTFSLRSTTKKASSQNIFYQKYTTKTPPKDCTSYERCIKCLTS